MKSSFKNVLQNVGLIDFARLFYNLTKTFPVTNLHNELYFRIGSLPDNYSVPSSKLIFLVIGTPWATEYWNSGKEVFDSIEEVFIKNNVTLNSKKILDFGCGSGRLIRHFNLRYPGNEFYGTDYNPELIDWCKQNLSFAKFGVNKLLPSLEYKDNCFDILYARSVFTHLNLDAQILWMNEFRRIMKPGGFIYLTTHGESTFCNLTTKEKQELDKKGIVVINTGIQGDNKCTTFQTKKHFKETLLTGFELQSFVAGHQNSNSKQDIYLLKKI